MMYTVYHIHIEPSLNKGYIGITNNYELRMSQHNWRRKKSNAHLRFALAKYGDAVQKSIIASKLGKETAEWIERILRPFPNTGWNIASGGNVPPSPKGKFRSAKYCANIAAAKQGSTSILGLRRRASGTPWTPLWVPIRRSRDSSPRQVCEILPVLPRCRSRPRVCWRAWV